jgi:hypothetical protein
MQRDYILRVIEQAIQAIAAAISFRIRGDADSALRIIEVAKDQVLGPWRQVLERLAVGSALELLGPGEASRAHAYALLLSEESEIHALKGDGLAEACRRRALEVYAACSLAGLPLDQRDLDRIGLLRSRGCAPLPAAYEGELNRILSGAQP